MKWLDVLYIFVGVVSGVVLTVPLRAWAKAIASFFQVLAHEIGNNGSEKPFS